jgi:hypothetical protein
VKRTDFEDCRGFFWAAVKSGVREELLGVLRVCAVDVVEGVVADGVN